MGIQSFRFGFLCRLLEIERHFDSRPLCQQLLGLCNGSEEGHHTNDNANLGTILGRLLEDIPKVCATTDALNTY